MKAQALTCRVFDQDIQLLVHSDLERAVLGVLCFISFHAAVSLGDKWVGDNACMLVGRTLQSPTLRQIIRHQNHDAVCERQIRFPNSQKVWAASHNFLLNWEPTCFWWSLVAGRGLWGRRTAKYLCSGSQFDCTWAVCCSSFPGTSSAWQASRILSAECCYSWPSLERFSF